MEELTASLKSVSKGWWINKLVRYVERALLATAALEGLGIRVIRVWEREVLRGAPRVAARIARAVVVRNQQRLNSVMLRRENKPRAQN